jgi:hypothetical protein
VREVKRISGLHEVQAPLRRAGLYSHFESQIQVALAVRRIQDQMAGEDQQARLAPRA